jgi:hypothetical protein
MKNETYDVVLPSNPADRKKIKGMIEEAALCLQKMDDQRAALKDICDILKADYQINPKFAKKMAKDYYKNTFNETLAEQSEYEALYEGLMETSE